MFLSSYHRESFIPLEAEARPVRNGRGMSFATSNGARCELSRPLTGFTLIELLVVIAVIAVIAVAVILTLNPLELLRQSRDANRLSDMETLNKAVSLYSADVGGSIGTAFTTYLSIPDPTATSTAGDGCQGLGLPALPSGWNYHCAALSNYQNTDGTGWVPINFKAQSFGSIISSLPKDPTNTTSSGFYYTYTPGGSYALTTTMESQKYLTKASQDGGYDPARYEVGSDLTLVAKWEGLVGWWTFDEGSGGTAKDSSGNGNNGTWNGTGTHWATGKVGAGAGQFGGSSANDYIHIPTSASLNLGTGPGSEFAWAYTTSIPGNDRVIDFGVNSAWELFVSAGSGNIGAVVTPAAQYSTVSIGLNAWHLIGFTLDSNGTLTIFKDGASIYSVNDSGSVTNNNGLDAYIGTDVIVSTDDWVGYLDDVRIYNRALSPAEIQNIYNAEK